MTSDNALGATAKEIRATILRAHEWNALDRRITPATSANEKPEHEEDVAGWLKAFGADE